MKSEGKQQVRKLTDWPSRWMQLACTAAGFSTCRREQHGCAVVRDNQLLTLGYNGSLPSRPHCEDEDCLLRWESYSDPTDRDTWEAHCHRTIHAERNAIVNAASTGISLLNAEWYVTGVPCYECSKLIARLKPSVLWVITDRGASKMLQWWQEQIKLYSHHEHSMKLEGRTSKTISISGIYLPWKDKTK